MKSTMMKFGFNGGELSPFLDGRTDFPKYTTGAKELTNFIPTVYGPITKRPGTRFVEDLIEESYLFPFEFSEDQAYIFAFKDYDVSVYTAGGRLLNEGIPVKFDSPYSIEQVKTLKFAQTGDIVYFTHPSVGVFKVSRTSASEFTGEMFQPEIYPFQDENIDENLTLAVTGSPNPGEYTIQSSEDLFVDADVGAQLNLSYIPSTEYDTWIPGQGEWSVDDILQYEGRIYKITAIDGTSPIAAGKRSPLHERGSKSDGVLTLAYLSDGNGYCEILAVTSPTEVIVLSTKGLPPKIVDGEPTSEWAWGSFGGRFGWPSAIVFHQQRMVLGGTLEQPQTIWGSVIGDIENFKEGVNDDEAYEFTIAANKKNPIAWLASNITLGIGTLGGEFIVSSEGSSITPTDVKIEQIGQYGSSSQVSPLIANGFTVFAQSGGRKLRELRYDDASRRNFARDLNKVAEHIADNGITEMAYQSEPYQVIWCVIGNQLYALTYETDEDVFAWSKQDCGEVISVATIPNGANDRLWLVVKRNGSYYIEYLTKFFRRSDSLDSACFLDSSLEYDGEEIQTLTGLEHLEGLEVRVLNNGSTEQPVTVTGGAITLQYPTTSCVVGLPYSAAWQSLRFEGGSNDGVGQGKSKRISGIIFRLEQTGAGLNYGKGTIDKEFTSPYGFIPVRSTNDNMDGPPALLNGDTWRQPIDGGTDLQYMLRVTHDEPTPCTIISIICTVDTSQ